MAVYDSGGKQKDHKKYKENYDKIFGGKDICKKRGIQLYFNKRDHRFSSSGLRQRVAEKQNGES